MTLFSLTALGTALILLAKFIIIKLLYPRHDDAKVDDDAHTLTVCTTCHCPDQEHELACQSSNEMKTGTIVFNQICDQLQTGRWRLKNASQPQPMKRRDAAPQTDLNTLQLISNDKNKNSMLNVVPLRCLSTCNLGHCIALTHPRKFKYQFGNLSVCDIEDICEMVDQYVDDKEDGYSDIRSRPFAMRHNILARIPPDTSF